MDGNANDEFGNNFNQSTASYVSDRHGNQNGAVEILNSTMKMTDIKKTVYIDLNKPFTVSIWAKINSAPSADMWLSLRTTSSKPFVILAGSHAAYRLSAGWGDGSLLSSTGISIPSFFGKWVNYVIVYSGDITSPEPFKMYFNNEKKILSAMAALGNYSNYYNCLGGSSHFSMDGCLDDIRIYDRQLTESEITALYNE